MEKSIGVLGLCVDIPFSNGPEIKVLAIYTNYELCLVSLLYEWQEVELLPTFGVGAS